MARETYNTSGLIAGQSFMEVKKTAAADAYVVGMPVKFVGTPVATAGTNTGNGTVTVLTNTKDCLPGSWTLELTAALVADVKDPNGVIVAKDVALTDGDETVITVDGLSFTVTDGATAFVDGDTFAIVVGSTGSYTYDIVSPEAICNEERTLESAGNLAILVGVSEVFETSIVSDAGVVLTLSAGAKLSLLKNGIILR